MRQLLVTRGENISITLVIQSDWTVALTRIQKTLKCVQRKKKVDVCSAEGYVWKCLLSSFEYSSWRCVLVCFSLLLLLEGLTFFWRPEWQDSAFASLFTVFYLFMYLISSLIFCASRPSSCFQGEVQLARESSLYSVVVPVCSHCFFKSFSSVTSYTLCCNMQLN